ncbi:MAG: hypothetical protein U0T79_01375 [Ferruginibacter sp.]
MKQLFFSAILAFTLLPAMAQREIPAGFVNGSVTLADGSVESGQIKDNLKKSASVVFLDAKGNKKTYTASQINAVNIGDTRYTCISGDFFKLLSSGNKMLFLQKASNASGSLSYNGAEAVVSAGTSGKIGDYFVYAGNQLKLVNKKNLDEFIASDLAACAPAVEKAKSLNGDIARLQEAVDIFNNN